MTLTPLGRTESSLMPPPPTDVPRNVMALLRRDPTRANELALLWALPRVSPGVARWHAKAVDRRDAGHEHRWEMHTIRHAAGNARWAGVVLGSSFYVGMPPAVVMIYCEQLEAMLRVAAIYGRDPTGSARAAEILVIQGSYPTVDLAARALREAATKPVNGSMTVAERLGALLHTIPPMIGLRLRRMKNPLDIAIGAVEAISLFVPIVSIPVWAYANGRATGRLGKTAVAFYAAEPEDTPAPEPPALLGPPTARARRNFVIALVALWLALGALAAVVPLGRYGHAFPVAGRVLAELGLAATFYRLITITRSFGHLAAVPDASDRPD